MNKHDAYHAALVDARVAIEAALTAAEAAHGKLSPAAQAVGEQYDRMCQLIDIAEGQ